MADLDNFFAKKDRSKKKSVKKFATTDELAKKLEDTKQKIDVKPKKERPVQEGEEAGAGPVEEEWKEYEEPVKDYTGLKIQVLQGGNGTPESSHDSTAEDSAPDNGKSKGPWNKPAEQEQPAPPPPAPVEQNPREPAKYVPPSKLVQRPMETQKRNLSKNAPDIHNDDYFPVLGASGKRGPAAGGWSTATAGGGAQPARGSAHKQPLALGNRFTTLQDDS